jgi:Arc/MetJ family transcription regulator
MRTTLNIPDGLLDEARQISGASSKTATVVYALQELIRARQIEALRKLRGKLPLEVDLETLREDRAHG